MENKKQKKQEKEHYASRLEARPMMNFGEATGKFSENNPMIRQRLGNVVTQLEMNNAEARQQLREMLEFQIR